MPLSHHPDIELVAGDDWVIEGQLTDVNGRPLPLAGVTFQWVLLNPDGEICQLAAIAGVAIDGDPANGDILITVPRGATAPLITGRYYDALRVIVPPDNASSEWIGTILVDADAFQQPQEPITL